MYDSEKVTKVEESLTAIPVAVSPIEKYREYLATRKKRLTREKLAIIEDVFSSHEHFDAEQLVTRLSQRKEGLRVSRATVYRALNDLVEAGMIRKVARSNDREVFEHDYGYPQHDHLICKSCQNLIEFHNEEISELIESVAAQHNFRVTGHRLEVYGLCQQCSRPPKRRHRKLDMV